ncbi:uncharacterized protein PV09_01748 [Verruconis gallopava]|uniref:Uncharacterized protein n=1 Tax=Verruconis gallopava TaxID=253628 RepID=A0A0D2AMT6_9PEZI|nr:uncharacterized protein PV09_01748 [Verruconis gallopava]KIW07830.1 hypothetical protein PV09_01748 [Verruconis gallopava]
MPAYESLQSGASMGTFRGRSDELVKTPLEMTCEPRDYYLKKRDSLPPPHIAHSHFVPRTTVEFLMRYKKDSAIGIKFFPSNSANSGRLDRITNLEGVLHTFVVPIVQATMHGDYRWAGGHGVLEFGQKDGYQLGREVLVSALVQQDFENSRVMMRVAALDTKDLHGDPRLPRPLTTKEKQDVNLRTRYDDAIRDYLIYHLTLDRRLPAVDVHIEQTALTLRAALEFLAQAIEEKEAHKLPNLMQHVFFYHEGRFISLEIMFQAALHQIRNEMVLLERLCGQQGYVYTFNPPAIFARFFGPYGTELLSRVHVAALKFFASTTQMLRCKIFAWADFNSPRILTLIRKALESQPHITVMSYDTLFSGKRSIRGQNEGLYSPPTVARGATLVIHNNSDAFGQNIETEASGGSLDGVIGTYSSAAASLMRDREDLCHNLYEIIAT